jgi:hypothetical protein
MFSLFTAPRREQKLIGFASAGKGRKVPAILLWLGAIAALVLIGSIVVIVLYAPINPTSTLGKVRLSQAARTSAPIVAALERYRRDTGTYPTSLRLLSPKYIQPRNVRGDIFSNGGRLWTYTGSSQEYSLATSPALVTGPILWFDCFDGRGTWSFDPGDGTAQTQLSIQITGS